MIHSCGQTHLQMKLNSNGFSIVNDDNNIENYEPLTLSTTPTQLYTSYLGAVTVDVPTTGDEISLEKYHIVNNKPLLVKIIDAKEHNLSTDAQYSLNYLKLLSSTKININENRYYYVATLMCIKKLAQINSDKTLIDKINQLLQPLSSNTSIITRLKTEFPELNTDLPSKSLKEYKKIYQKVTAYNSSVDIFFSTCNYLDFLFENTGLVSVNNLNSLISINGVPKLDNAFFTGQYMVYGSGDKMFYPLTSLDVIGHELSHGLVSGTADLEYKGHSGALNESFSDIMGTMFEFHMYEKFPNLLGKKDWLIGEDLGMDKPFLRSMENPNAGNQPDKYKGLHYINPNSSIDFGGVHINSGITNYCFYLASQHKDKKLVLKYFIQCLNKLSKKSNFNDFRDTLKTVSNNDPIIINALNKVGLNDTVVSDYNTGPPKQKQRQPQPIPQRYPQPFPQPYPQPYPQPIPQRYPQPYPQPIPQRYPQPYPQHFFQTYFEGYPEEEYDQLYI